MACGNGSDRTAHPVELFGENWSDWEPRRPEQVIKLAPKHEIDS